jgi:midasin
MTETTRENAADLAVQWSRAKATILEGPTSAGKTSLVRYLSYKTGTPYRRINVSFHTEVSDLLGHYVGGEQRYTKEELEKMTDEQLGALGAEYGLEAGLTRAQRVKVLFDAQLNPRWVDGPVVRAMRRGEVLLIDEINLARPDVLERLNSLLDDDREIRLTEHRNEIIRPNRSFRIFATMNPASYQGRARLSAAVMSRWDHLYTQGLSTEDLTLIMREKFGNQIPDGELAKLITAHEALSRAADDGTIGATQGGIAFSLRNLVRAGERFIRYRGGALDDAALMRRETEELYRGGLFEAQDQQAVDDILKSVMPYQGPAF